jgi:hypothetical protein
MIETREKSMRHFLSLFLVSLQLLLSTEESGLRIVSPTPYQVLQRDPVTVQGKPGTGGYRAGSASVALVLSQALACEWRLVALDKAFGKGTEWVASASSTQTHTIVLPAGGWYRLEVRRPGANSIAAQVEPIGVGEVFLIAGQSYAANCNDERLRVSEPQKRVTCLDPKTGAWRVADDPQPGASDYKGGGTIWPAFGDGLTKQLTVPVGFANVAWQGTASSQWMPKGNLHNSMVAAARRLGRFRAVLWQQGESDVIGGVSADTYVANITAIREAMVTACGFEFPWMPAKSTIHPNVYNNPKGEAVIRGAVDTLWKTKGFFPGPDTDTLTGDNRGGPSSCSHFSGKGQKNAAAMWVEAVTKLIEGKDK